jgi:hypothetical protein
MKKGNSILMDVVIPGDRNVIKRGAVNIINVKKICNRI